MGFQWAKAAGKAKRGENIWGLNMAERDFKF